MDKEENKDKNDTYASGNDSTTKIQDTSHVKMQRKRDSKAEDKIMAKNMTNEQAVRQISDNCFKTKLGMGMTPSATTGSLAANRPKRTRKQLVNQNPGNQDQQLSGSDQSSPTLSD